MKAIISTKYGSPDFLELREVEKPTPQDNEVLVRIYAATVTRGDVMLQKLPTVAYLPLRFLFGVNRHQILGHEFAGEIEAVGSAVTKFMVGDVVFGTPTGARSGSHAEYVAVPEDGIIVTKPATVTFEEAAAIPVGALTALQILRKGNVARGQNILIYGASGSVGTYAVQIAKHFGATVTGVCSAANVDMVKSLGASRVIDYTQQDFIESGQAYDLIFDAVGKLDTKAGKRVLKPGGNLVSIQTSTTERAEDLHYVRELLEAGEIKAVIDRCYSLAQVPEAHRYVETGRKKGNVVITV